MEQFRNRIGDVMEVLAENSDVLFAMAERIEDYNPDELSKHADSLRAIGYDLLSLQKELGDARIWPRELK